MVSSIMLKSILIVALVCYGGLLALLYLTQRAMQYFPERFRTAPAEAGLPEAQEIELETPDGERVIAWHVPPRGDKPVILYFHGNGGSLRGRAERFRALTADGTGLVALSYRGYGGSSGRPTEAGLIAMPPPRTPSRARATRRIASCCGASRSAPGLRSRSLRKSRSRASSSNRPSARPSILPPRRYWFVPVRWLMKDQFRSDLRIGKVTAPVLVLHGERDTVVPIASGRAALRADQCAQTLRPVSGRRAQRSRRQWGPRGREAVSRGDITVKAASWTLPGALHFAHPA